ncbi:MAG TPA: hypothetical protein V6D10_09085 [Trichocoleus sp.]
MSEIRIGTIVEILQPDYAAGKVGRIVAPEVLQNGQASDRWIIKVVGEDLILSLLPEDFRSVHTS